MRPDYPNKIFSDERISYPMLMQALAEDAICPLLQPGQTKIVCFLPQGLCLNP